MRRLPVMYPSNARVHKCFAEHFLYMMVPATPPLYPKALK